MSWFCAPRGNAKRQLSAFSTCSAKGLKCFCGFAVILVSVVAFGNPQVKGLWDVWGLNGADSLGKDFLPTSWDLQNIYLLAPPRGQLAESKRFQPAKPDPAQKAEISDRVGGCFLFGSSLPCAPTTDGRSSLLLLLREFYLYFKKPQCLIKTYNL